MENTDPVQLAFNSMEPEDCAKDKSPIIFLHGITASKEIWRDIPQIVANETKRKVFVVDARNHGDSPWTHAFDSTSNVADLLNFMDSHDIPRAIIVGHSMGGLIGILTALQEPGRVEKLVVEDMNTKNAPKAIRDMILLYLSLAQVAIHQVPLNATEDEAKKLIGEFIINGFPPEIRTLTSQRNSVEVRVVLKQDQNGRYVFKANNDLLIRVMKEAEKLLIEPTVGTYEGPAYFIYGTLSPFQVGSDKDHLRKFFPNAKFTAIRNASHNVHNDCPEEFTDALLQFLLKH